MPTRASSLEFTHDREANWALIAAVLGALFALEGALVHWWLASSDFAVAKWLAAGFHAFCLLWLALDTVALRLGRSTVHTDAAGKKTLHLRVGLRGFAAFPFSLISSVRTGTFDGAGPGSRLLSVTNTANVEIRFTEGVSYGSAFGRTPSFTRLLLQVDDAARFARAFDEICPAPSK